MRRFALLPSTVISTLLITIQFSVAENVAKDIFILAGQSNMAGRGGVHGHQWDGIVPTECQPNSSIYRLNAELSWEVARETLHRDVDIGECGIGPGMSFANKILQANNSLIFGVVGLVPCAVSGSKISQWKKGSTLYDELIRRANASLIEGGKIRAVLWYQGESDSTHRSDAEAYKEKIKKFIVDLRFDLNISSLLVIQVALASGGRYKDIVRAAQQQIDLPNVTYVDAMGLPLNEDKLHLTTLSQVHLGQKLAQAFLACPAHNNILK